MNTSNKYNGWTNYETWNANLWIDNDWQLSEMCAMIAADLFGSYEDHDTMTHILAERIKEAFEDNQPELPASFYSDVLNASMREVNWFEIAAHYIENEAECQELREQE
jgi:hypothetical protein